jgi:hypothetical protein
MSRKCEVAAPPIKVRLVGRSGPDLLTLSSSHFDPERTSGILQVLLLSHSEDDLGGYNDSFMVLGADLKLRPFMPLDGRASDGGAGP